MKAPDLEHGHDLEREDRAVDRVERAGGRRGDAGDARGHADRAEDHPGEDPGDDAGGDAGGDRGDDGERDPEPLPAEYLEEAQWAHDHPDPDPPPGFRFERAFRDFSINVAELRPTPRREPGSLRSATRASDVANEERISETKSDPRLRPFVIAMANAIIKDMLREKRERGGT